MINSKKHFLIILNILFFISFQGVTDDQLQNIDMRTFIYESEICDNLVLSGKGSLTYEWTKVDTVSTYESQKFQEIIDSNSHPVYINKMEIFFAFSGSKIYADEHMISKTITGKETELFWKKTFDNEKISEYVLNRDEQGLFHPVGYIRESNDYSYEYDPRIKGGMYIWDTPVSTFLKGNLKNLEIKTLHFIKDEEVDNIQCKVFLALFKGNDDSLTVWIAPSRMYRPKIVELKTDYWKIVKNYDFKKNNGDIWFPNQMNTKTYRFDEDKADFVLSVNENLILHDDFQINIDIPDSQFIMNFPKGLKIHEKKLAY